MKEPSGVIRLKAGWSTLLGLLLVVLTVSSPALTSSVTAFYSLESPPDSLSSLVGRSTLVVVGTVGKVVSTFYGTNSVGAQLGPFSVREVDSVSEVIGSGTLPVYVGNFPYFQQSREYLFFLQYLDRSACAPSPPSPPCIWPPGLTYQYRTVFGPAGVFLIDRGLLYGVLNPNPQQYVWPIVIRNGTALSEILSQIRTLDFLAKLPIILMLSTLGTILVLADITILRLKRREKSMA